MTTANKRYQRGVGLVEVLIAVIIVALGLLGLASFEGSLMQSSGDSKARAEAMALAQEKIEEFRKSVDLDTATHGYNNLSSSNDTVNGANATFSRSWVLTDDTAFIATAPPRKEITVRVSWVGSDNQTNNIYAVSELAWIDPAKSFLYANQDSGGTAAVPSPRQNASEDVRSASENVNDPDVISPTETPLPAYKDLGGTSPDSISSFDVLGNDNNTYTLQKVSAGSRYFYTAFGNGVLGVYVCEDNGICRYIQNHFGGVVLTTRGTVYSYNGNNFSNITVAWTSSDVTACYQGQVSTNPDATSLFNETVYQMPYECVYAGNCNQTGSNVNGCVDEALVNDTQINDKNVGPGGEFGDIGLIGLDGSNGGDQLCFLEDTPYWGNTKSLLNGARNSSGNPAYNPDYLLPVTKRFYVSRRKMSDGSERSEGINRSYTNHDFLLVSRANSPESYKNCFKAVNAVTSNTSDVPVTTVKRDFYRALFDVPQREVVRVMGVDAAGPAINRVAAPTTFAGTMPGVTINSNSAGSSNDVPSLYASGTMSIAGTPTTVNELGTCYVKSDNSKYACILPQNTTNLTMNGESINEPDTTSDDPPITLNYDTCSATINTSTAENLSAACNWTSGTGFP